MLTQEEQRQLRVEQVSDHLIVRPDFFNLNADQLVDFLDWMQVNFTSFYDAHTDDGEWVEDFDIDGMFDTWKGRNLQLAA